MVLGDLAFGGVWLLEGSDDFGCWLFWGQFVLWELTFWGTECLLGTGFLEGRNSFFLGCWNLAGGGAGLFLGFFWRLPFFGRGAFSWVGILPMTLQRASLQDGDSHHAPPGQETHPGRLQWVSFGVPSAWGTPPGHHVYPRHAHIPSRQWHSGEEVRHHHPPR